MGRDYRISANKTENKIYAYLPSHYGYSDMEMEELIEFRKLLLLGIMEKNGIKGIKDYSRQRKKENRWKPKIVLVGTEKFNVWNP